VLPFTDHYRTLGVHRDAEPAVIEAAYRALVRRYHPDVNRHDRNAEDRLKAINAAYAVLSNAAARGVYDREWDAHHAPPKPEPPKPPRAKSTPHSGAAGRPKPAAKPSQAPPQNRAPGAPPKRSRPWYVNVAGFAILVLVLRVIGDTMAEPEAPIASRTARPSATSRPAVGATRVPPRPTPTPRATGDVLSVPKTPESTNLATYLDEEAPSLTLESGAWGFAESFGPSSMWDARRTEKAESYLSADGLVLAIKSPGGFDAYLYDSLPSGGRDFGFLVTVDSTSGWGEISIVLTDANGGPEWLFGVDPVAEEWYLYRTSDYTAEFFYWVEPRPFGAIAPGPVRSLEARGGGGGPTHLKNSRQVV
jgi:curved DNA-binding protein CbpA